MALIAEQAAFLLDVSRLIKYASESGLTVTGGELFRTPEQQELYLKAGKSKIMASKHLERLAIDLILYKDGVYQKDSSAYRSLGEYWKSLDVKNRWGGDWGWDGNHFERRA